jgi:dolichyl-diphosphooligosaccharide--protein glycosyltransferase
MVDGKFNAPVTFYDAGNASPRDFQRNIYQVNQETGQIRQAATLRTQRYYESQMIRLYAFHGSAADPAPIVVDWDVRTVETANGPVQIRTVPEDGQLVRQDFQSVQEARQYVENDTTAQLGGFSNLPEERVDALEHYRQVKVNAYEGASAQNYPAVKLFERVPGATVEGSGPANTTVTAQVEMEVPSRNSTFTYKQYAETGADGTFEMTLPYSTTGYENWGVEEGYTNVSIRATGPYTFSTGLTADENMTISRYTASANVTEGQVVGEEDAPVSVDLERQIVSQPDGANNSTDTSNTSAVQPITTDADLPA